ncbi:MAG: long-chain fatty acid--CoA ligase [Steroidobacteraceae bacterium]
MGDPENLHEWFRRRTARGPDRPALSFQGETWSYGDMQRRIERLSAVFAAGGLGPGDRVAYLGLNHSIVVLALFAAARLGAILVPINFRLTRPEVTAIIEDAGAHTVVADARHAPLLDAAREDLSCRSYFCLEPLEGWDLIGPCEDSIDVPPAVSARADDVVTLVYTSGTTGKPKGVMLSHRNLWTSSLNWILTCDMSSRDVVLDCTPLFHVGGLCALLTPTLMMGGHAVLHESFDPLLYLEDIARYGVTVNFAVPAMLLAASQHERFRSVDLSTLRFIVAAGAPVPEPLLRTFNQHGVPISQCYGQTEATSAVTFLEPNRAAVKLGACGRPGLLNEVRLVDAAGGVITEPGVHGEICVRGGIVTQGYWNRPLDSEAAMDAEGWLHSGDIAYRDEEGFYYICDRLKDMIISGGENIYPAEIESVLYEHPSVAEAAVIGAADDRWGEVVVALIVLKPATSLMFDDLIRFLTPRLARYKLPRDLHVLDVMPRNSNGKVLKNELRQRFGTTHSKR